MRGSRDGKPGKNGGGRRNHVTVKMLWWIILPLVEKWAELSRVFGPFDLGFKNTAFERAICTCIVLCNFCVLLINRSVLTTHFMSFMKRPILLIWWKFDGAMKRWRRNIDRVRETSRDRGLKTTQDFLSLTSWAKIKLWLSNETKSRERLLNYFKDFYLLVKT